MQTCHWRCGRAFALYRDCLQRVMVKANVGFRTISASQVGDGYSEYLEPWSAIETTMLSELRLS